MSTLEAIHTRPRRARLLEAIDRLAAMEPEPRVRIALAEAEFRLALAPGTEPAEAIERLRAARAHDPFSPKLYLHLGRLLHQSGRYRGAISEYRRAIQLAPSSRRAHQLLGLALLELGKQDQEIGQALITALSNGSLEELREAIAALDTRVAEQTEQSSKKTGPGRTARRAARRAADADPSRWPDAWRVALVEQLSRPKPVRAHLTANLETGLGQLSGGSVGEYVCACVLMVAGGDPPAEIHRLAGKAGLDLTAQEPAVALLAATLELAQIANPATFVHSATAHLELGVLPPELVCWLHFMKCGPTASLALTDALLLLDTYPESIRDLDCFRELRLAVLDDYARKAWAGERFDEAKLLWRATIPLDPQRVPVAINLALLAARTRSVEDYPQAWDRLVELLYLYAAGVGDVQLFLEDRVALHLALCQQSRERHCTTPGEVPEEEQVANWVADTDALEVWLQEWDLYYLNARLHFRSPTHLLGVPKDASTTVLTEARDSLVQQIGVLRARGWAGLGVFCDLAADRVHEAFRQAENPVDRARDPYHELEKPRADALARELRNRAVVLHKMMEALADRNAARHIPLGCSIARRQFILPRTILQNLCVDDGIIGHDIQLFEVFEVDLVNLATRWNEPEADSKPEWSRRLSALDECLTVLPHRLEVHSMRCQLLHVADRRPEAYAAALAALELPVPPDDAESADRIRTGLIGLIDSVGDLELPEAHRQPQDREAVERAVAPARNALERYPHSATLRQFLASALAGLGGETRMREAIDLLTAGIEIALSDEQRHELEEQLREIRGAAATDAVRQRVKALAEPAIDRASEAIEACSPADPAAREATREVVREAVAAVSQALDLARNGGLSDQVSELTDALTQLQEVDQRLRSGKE